MASYCFTDKRSPNDENNINLDQLNSLEYNIFGILNYLQTEWTKMGIQRSQWEYERAEMQTKISILQNERKGQENLKNDLVRRIKMLEYALRQERYKNFNAKYPNETPLGKPDTALETFPITNSSIKSDRARLRQHLNKLGLDEKSSEVRANSVKELLGISVPSDNDQPNDLKVLESAFSEFSFRNPNGSVTTNNNKKESNSRTNYDLDDADTARALAEFDLLVAQQTDVPGNILSRLSKLDLITSSVDPFSVEFTAPGSGAMDPEWLSGDQTDLMDRLKEQYRLGMPFARGVRAETKGVESPPETSTVSLYDDIQTFYPDSSSPSSSSYLNKRFDFTENASPPIMHKQSTQVSNAQTNTFGLGDLASLTVANEADHSSRASALDNLDGVSLPLTGGASGEASSTVTEEGKSERPATVVWNAKYTLRSHFDSIRAIIFHQTEQIILTGSEDHTLKLWNLTKTVQAKKSSSLDVEPMYICRGHTSPVLCITMATVSEATGQLSGRESPLDTSNNFAFSGCLDGEIRSWRFGNLQLALYDNFDLNVIGPVLRGHTNAVWSLAFRSDGALLSASSDGTVRLWNVSPLLHHQSGDQSTCITIKSAKVYRVPGLTIAATVVPTSISFLPSDNSAFAVGLISGDVCIIGLESGRVVTRFEGKSSASDDQLTPPGAVNALAVHPTLPLVIVAHENRQIRFLDTSLGHCIHTMVAHLDAVTSLAVDSQGTYLLSASHDSSIRLWDIESKTCVQELTSHRKKYDESIHCVALHNNRPLMASAGADGLAKVFVGVSSCI